MAENSINLSILLIGALNDFAHVEELQLLLQIGLEQADRLTVEACKRLAFLVETYICQVEPWLEEVRFGLDRLKQVVVLEEDS